MSLSISYDKNNLPEYCVISQEDFVKFRLALQFIRDEAVGALVHDERARNILENSFQDGLKIINRLVGDE